MNIVARGAVVRTFASAKVRKLLDFDSLKLGEEKSEPLAMSTRNDVTRKGINVHISHPMYHTRAWEQ
jgi:hypothetical protein